MANWLRQRLSAGEIVGLIIFLAGFILLVVRGGIDDPWIELAIWLMAAGFVLRSLRAPKA